MLKNSVSICGSHDDVSFPAMYLFPPEMYFVCVPTEKDTAYRLCRNSAFYFSASFFSED